MAKKTYIIKSLEEFTEKYGRPKHTLIRVSSSCVVSKNWNDFFGKTFIHDFEKSETRYVNIKNYGRFRLRKGMYREKNLPKNASGNMKRMGAFYISEELSNSVYEYLETSGKNMSDFAEMSFKLGIEKIKKGNKS